MNPSAAVAFCPTEITPCGMFVVIAPMILPGSVINDVVEDEDVDEVEVEVLEVADDVVEAEIEEVEVVAAEAARVGAALWVAMNSSRY